MSALDRPDGGVRLIQDLSAPCGDSINDGIDSDESRTSYTTIDEAIRLIFVIGGRGALLAKVDVRAAFKLIPVRPEQRRLLGFQWDGRYYYQAALSFGSRSSSRIFTDFADCLEALFQQMAGLAEARKYIDDFWVVSPGDAPDEAEAAYQHCLRVCAEVGVPSPLKNARRRRHE